MKTRSPEGIIGELARALVEGAWEEDALVARGALVLGRRGRWLRPLVRRLRSALGDSARPRAGLVAKFLRDDPGFWRAWAGGDLTASWARRPPAVMFPAAGAPTTWNVPAITSPAALAARLGLSDAELEWFADRQARGRRTAAGPLVHYLYRWQTKRLGSARLIEAPKARLKAIQRRLLDELLEAIPPHEAAHGFRAGRSVRSYLEPHVGCAVVLKMDLRDFFPSISAARITAIWLTAGYPEPVARLLSGLCTGRVPQKVWTDPACPVQGLERSRLARLHASPHLPQGAPTSPALANLCAYRLDCRLEALARAAGGRYTRYADDLAFSGDTSFARSIERFHVMACALALEEGFVVQTRKTRIMRQGNRQRVAGVVVNAHPNISRADYDALKAILHNCVRHGPHGQNRHDHPNFQAHLRGRVEHAAFLNPDRGQRLRALFDQIVW